MTTQRIFLDFPSPHVANLAMRDAQTGNAFTKPFISELLQNLKFLSEKSKEEIKVVLLSGLPDVFSSGANREVLQDLGSQQKDPSDIILSRLLLHLPIPVVAAMEGHAVGGGFALGLCADMVFLAQESRFGFPFMNMGFTPGMGTTRLVEHFFAPPFAQEMLYSGTYYKGKVFENQPGVHVFPKSLVLEKALDLAERIAEKPKKSLVLLKRSLSLARRKAFEESITLESMMHEICFNQKETLQQIEENYIGHH